MNTPSEPSSEPADSPMHRRVQVERYCGAECRHDDDSLVVEEPLEIRLNDSSFSVTMRTPGQDRELAVGFLVTEGILRVRSDLFDVTQCAEPDFPDLLNVVTVYADPDRVPVNAPTGRQRYATAGCGLCGRATIEEVRRVLPGVLSAPQVSRALLATLPDRLRAAQSVFERTGGLHAAGLFDTEGFLLYSAEDVGRHNGVDKVVGQAFLSGGWPHDARSAILMVSGRAGFEIVQKAAAAGIPALCSVSAPSSLAVELAVETGMVLVGFLRGDRMNVYSGFERIAS